MSVELPIAMTPAPAGPAASRTGAAKGQAAATTDTKDADDAFSLALSTADGAPADASATQDDPSGIKTKGKSDAQATDGASPQPTPAVDPQPPVIPVDNALLLAQSALSGRDLQGAAAAASAAAAAAASAAGPAAALASAASTSAAADASGVSAVSALSAASVASADGAAAGFLPIGRAVPRGPVPVQALVSDAGRGSAAGRGATADTAAAHARPPLRAADDAGVSPARGAASNAADALGSGSASARNAASAAQSAQSANSASMSSQAATQRLTAQDAAHAASASASAVATASAAVAATANVPAPSTDAAALQAMMGADVFGRRSERLDERIPGAADALPGALPGSGGTAGTSALMTPVDAASAGASLGQNDLSDRMLEQVSWWLSQKTQGAELKLDVAGGQTVSVSVQVQGNEAHVAFRSDQPEVRQMLNQAMPQLKELLGSEGLMLSGSSVGAQSDGSGQASAQQAARQWQDTLGMGSAPAAADALRTAPAPISRAPSGRSLDLYV